MRKTIFNDAVELVKGMGFQCFVPVYKSASNDIPTYCYITDGVNIGYMQVDWLGCSMSFSSVHKPCSVNGTGFGVAEDIALSKITKELVERTFISRPHWANRKRDKAPVVKYKDWEDYTKNSLTGRLCLEFRVL